jgi:hypothetical protein
MTEGLRVRQSSIDFRCRLCYNVLMSHSEQQPNFSNNPDAAFESVVEGMLDFPDLEDEFQEFDKYERIGQKEQEVIDYLDGKIRYVEALKKMLRSLENVGVQRPICENVRAVMSDMRRSGDFEDFPSEYHDEMNRLETLTLYVEQIAGAQATMLKMDLGSVLHSIHVEKVFTPEEQDELTAAATHFMADK